ncbi:MAG: 50S ribosomal protein L29 [Elusimicrobia bacterium]|nr:50S ribosomal protein L29 [Elusimicrobiota bacterium]MDE2237242.1 50S ribosomal protein L29 [Elusimicrobiota bacterium]MDE2425318.1 50S ribosomal protein L29 [Elusimicrobiota bacterium]
MKINEKQLKKALSIAELETELRQAQEKRFKLRFKHRVTPLNNPVELRTLRRQIACFKTWIGEKRREETK